MHTRLVNWDSRGPSEGVRWCEERRVKIVVRSCSRRIVRRAGAVDEGVDVVGKLKGEEIGGRRVVIEVCDFGGSLISESVSRNIVNSPSAYSCF